MITTYPLAANSSGFQRYDQSSPHAPSGPPWMRNFTGYFLLASKFGGFTMKPWTFSFAAPVNQKFSSGCISTCESTDPFRFVTACAFDSRQSGILYAFGGTAIRHCGNSSGALRSEEHT